MVAVTIPAEIGDTSIPASKLIVPAVPTKDPLSLTITPVSYTHLTLPTNREV